VIIFAKYNTKMLIGLELYFYIWCFIAFFPLQRSLKAYYYTSLRARGDMSTAKWMVFGPVDLAHSEKLTLIQRHLKNTNCSSLDLLNVGPSTCRCDTPGSYSYLPFPQSCCCLRPLIRASVCPQLDQISRLGIGDWLT